MKKAVESATINFTELLNNAIETKKAEEVAQVIEEATPEGEYLSSWNTTPEEIDRINAGNRKAVDRFFFEEKNNRHILNLAYSFLRREERLKSVVSVEDLVQQVYLDLATGFIKFRAFDRGIGNAILASFRFTPVGGLDEVYIAKTQRSKNAWANARN